MHSNVNQYFVVWRMMGIFTNILIVTCSIGERRIRVLTLCLPVTNSMSELFASADQIAIANYLANKG